MWIFFKGGAFLSIVQKPTDKGANTLTVRARAKGDIERIFPGAQVVVGQGSDYLHRAVLPRSVVVARIADAVEAIDFSNFKDTVRDKRRAGILSRVWGVLLELQPGGLRGLWGR